MTNDLEEILDNDIIVFPDDYLIIIYVNNDILTHFFLFTLNPLLQSPFNYLF